MSYEKKNTSGTYDANDDGDDDDDENRLASSTKNLAIFDEVEVSDEHFTDDRSPSPLPRSGSDLLDISSSISNFHQRKSHSTANDTKISDNGALELKSTNVAERSTISDGLSARIYIACGSSSANRNEGRSDSSKDRNRGRTIESKVSYNDDHRKRDLQSPSDNSQLSGQFMEREIQPAQDEFRRDRLALQPSMIQPVETFPEPLVPTTSKKKVLKEKKKMKEKNNVKNKGKGKKIKKEESSESTEEDDYVAKKSSKNKSKSISPDHATSKHGKKSGKRSSDALDSHAEKKKRRKASVSSEREVKYNNSKDKVVINRAPSQTESSHSRKITYDDAIAYGAGRLKRGMSRDRDWDPMRSNSAAGSAADLEPLRRQSFDEYRQVAAGARPGLRRLVDQEVAAGVGPGGRRLDDRDVAAGVMSGGCRLDDRDVEVGVGPGGRRLDDRDVAAGVGSGGSRLDDRDLIASGSGGRDPSPPRYDSEQRKISASDIDEDIVQLAVDDVNAKIHTIRSAAEAYGIPASRIFRKKNPTPRSDKKRGVKNALEKSDEDELVQRLLIHGRFKSVLSLRNFVRDYLNEKGLTITRFANNLPGNDWVSGLLQRNPIMGTVIKRYNKQKPGQSPCDLERTHSSKKTRKMRGETIAMQPAAQPVKASDPQVSTTSKKGDLKEKDKERAVSKGKQEPNKSCKTASEMGDLKRSMGCCSCGGASGDLSWADSEAEKNDWDVRHMLTKNYSQLVKQWHTAGEIVRIWSIAKEPISIDTGKLGDVYIWVSKAKDYLKIKKIEEDLNRVLDIHQVSPPTRDETTERVSSTNRPNRPRSRSVDWLAAADHGGEDYQNRIDIGDMDGSVNAGCRRDRLNSDRGAVSEITEDDKPLPIDPGSSSNVIEVDGSIQREQDEVIREALDVQPPTTKEAIPIRDGNRAIESNVSDTDNTLKSQTCSFADSQSPIQSIVVSNEIRRETFALQSSVSQATTSEGVRPRSCRNRNRGIALELSIGTDDDKREPVADSQPYKSLEGETEIQPIEDEFRRETLALQLSVVQPLETSPEPLIPTTSKESDLKEKNKGKGKNAKIEKSESSEEDAAVGLSQDVVEPIPLAYPLNYCHWDEIEHDGLTVRFEEFYRKEDMSKGDNI